MYWGLLSFEFLHLLNIKQRFFLQQIHRNASEQKETDTILVITQIATIVMLEDPLFDVFVVWLDSPFPDPPEVLLEEKHNILKNITVFILICN